MLHAKELLQSGGGQRVSMPRHISEILAELMPKYKQPPLEPNRVSPTLISYRRNSVEVESRDFAGVQFNG